MTAVAYPDVFEPRERIRNPLAGSIVFHLGIVAALVGWERYVNRPHSQFGDPNALSGGVVITAVSQIPLPSRAAPINPLANDTESKVPAPPKPEVRKQEDDRDTVTLKTKKEPPKKKNRIEAKRESQKSALKPEPKAVQSTTGARASTPMFGTTSSGGGVGIGQGNPFGARFGWYADLIKQRVAEKWRTQDLDPQLSSAPAVVLTFEILRSGEVRNIHLLQRSGNYALDTSAQRAVQEASPLPALPDGYERSYASVEFHFQFKR